MSAAQPLQHRSVQAHLTAQHRRKYGRRAGPRPVRRGRARHENIKAGRVLLQRRLVPVRRVHKEPRDRRLDAAGHDRGLQEDGVVHY